MIPAQASKEVVRTVTGFIDRAAAAQKVFEGFSQEEVNNVVTGVAWAIYRPDRARALAEIAVRDTGLGNVEDKVLKNRRKIKGALRDLTGVRTVGLIRDHPETGLSEYAKPVGIVAAVVPSTNPAATPVDNAMKILKGRNAVVFSPSPRGASTCALLVDFIHAELDKLGAPRDLVQFLEEPSKELAHELMRQADLVVVTGSQKNVRAAYSSGTPALGVGAGNVAVIVDETADLHAAAAKIRQSKTFDHATSCSSENSVHIHDSVYEVFLKTLEAEGGYLLRAEEKRRLEKIMWQDGRLNDEIVAKPPDEIARKLGLSHTNAQHASFFMVAEEGAGPSSPFSGEKLSVVLALYRFNDFDRCLDRIERIYEYQGSGHSVGIHTQDETRARRLAERLKVARVLVNQAHAFGSGGSFDNGLGFTLTMGAGTWAGNSFSENLSYRHFLNITSLAQPIPHREPTEEELWGIVS